MSSQFSGSYEALKITKEDVRKKGIIWVCVGLLLFALFFYDAYNFLNIPTLVQVMLLLSGTIMMMFYIDKMFTPIKKWEEAFLCIVDAIKLLENSRGEIVLIRKAYKKLKLGTSMLEKMDIGDAPWYINTINEEKKLIDNLKRRVMPAILNNDISTSELIDIAYIFQQNNIDLMNTMNKRMETLKEYPSEVDTRTYIKNLIKNIYVRALISFGFGTSLITLILGISCYILGIDIIITIKSNVVPFTIGLITISLAILKLFLNE